jgi:NAD(P)-dependent dehydrogenase (short-subunit alcohol dehydrogenase family)
MSIRSDGRAPIALISGANKGLGFAIARGLARAGHHVLIGCRDIAQGNKAVAILCSEGGRAEALALDVADDTSIDIAAAVVRERIDRLDVLVNNAGVALDRQIGVSSLRTVMRDTFEVNVFGLACLTDAMTPLLARSAHPRIVNMASGLGSLALNSDPNHEFAKVKLSAYNTSKAGVTMLTVIYAARLRDRGIKVNAADPGFCATDLNGHSGYRSAEQGAAIAIKLATLDDDGPSGGFFDETGPVPW